MLSAFDIVYDVKLKFPIAKIILSDGIFCPVSNGIPWGWVLLFGEQFVKVTENKFDILILVLELLLYFFDFKFDVQVIGQHLPDMGKYPHNLNVDFDCLFAVQNA